jgi:DNA-binding Lrp family transcriptional regulator
MFIVFQKMMLKPQDIVILLKVQGLKGRTWTYEELAKSLGMSASEVHAGLKRCETSGLYGATSRQIRSQAVLEFLIHGLKYVFPVQPGAIGRGIPTAHSAEPLKSLVSSSAESAYVWADFSGMLKGQTIAPLYRSVPVAVKSDQFLYELLSLIDAIRLGRVREQQLASELLEQRLGAI